MSGNSQLLLDPGYTTNDCITALQLVQEEVHTRCCMDESDCTDGAPPSRCGYDCAHIWWEFAQDCHDYLDAEVADGHLPDAFTDHR